MSGGSPALRFAEARGRWVIAAAVLGSGVAFLDGTVVNAALPAIAKNLDADLADLQWVLDGYLLSLSALLVLGGSFGDLFGRRRVFVTGLVGFAVASLLCGIAPNVLLLIVARILQGIAAALLVPGSLAIISASFHPDDRGRAIGAWSGLAGISTALGPFVGGWMIDSISWRLVFLINLPIIAITVVITRRHVPETRDETAQPRVDWLGGATLAFGLGGIVYGLIEGPASGWPPATIVLIIVGVVSLLAFLVVERRAPQPMVPLGVFRSRQFSGANAVTFAVYAALSGVLFLLVVHLQAGLGYSAFGAGVSLLPITVIMLLFSARAGALAQRIGPRLPMTVGPLIMAGGLVLLTRVEPGTSYWSTVFPAVLVLAAGLALTVAPLTAAVLGAIDDHHAGVGSAINNAVSRIAGLLAIAVLPGAAGIAVEGGRLDLVGGFARAMEICAVLVTIGGVLAFVTIREGKLVREVTRSVASAPCGDPCLGEDAEDLRAAS